MLGVFLILSGCAYHQKIPFEKTKTLYQGQDLNDPLILRQTPMLLIHNSASIYNRIGRPSARYDDQGEEQIYVDTEHPVIYYLKRTFTTSKGQYTNLIYLRPGVHRVMDIAVVEEGALKKSLHFTILPASLKPMQELERIPLDAGTTSFYYNKGVLKGHVKGSVKPWESIFLSLPSLDFFVGTDNIYGDRKETDNPFYTSLKPWNREASDMWYFATFLKFWGWRL